MRSNRVAALLLASMVAAACTGASTGDRPAGASSTTAAASTTTGAGPATTVAPEPDLSALDGLGFGDFVEESYRLLLVRSPEFLTSLGIAADYGMRNDQLDDLSPGYLAETQALESAILDRLHGHDRSALSPEDQVTYDAYEWYIDQQVRGHRFAYHGYPVHHFVNSYNFNLILFLAEEHPLDSVDDAEDYIARVSQIDRQVAQVLERLARSEAMGVMPARVIATWTIGALREDLGGATRAEDVVPTRLRLYTAFVERIERAEGIDDDTKRALADRVEAEVVASFVPAWVALLDHMEQIEPLTSTDPGVGSRLPDGAEYYAWLLRDQTSTDLTPEEVHQIGLDNVARLQGELRAAFDRLGYPPDASLNALRERAAGEAGLVGGPGGGGDQAVIDAYEELIARAEVATRPFFGLWPASEVRIIPEAAGRGGYYVPGSVDGSRPGSFHAGVGGGVNRYSMATVTFHEAVPGHHTQIAIAQELDLPTFRRFERFNAFVEGWALYAERLAAEAGLYDDDPYGDIGRLELELLRAVRLVVDTGVHAFGWSRSEAHDYMDDVIEGWGHEVERYMVLPAQATGYMIGQQEILDLRERATGAGMSLSEFHDAVLGGGNLPLAVLTGAVGG